MKKKRKAPKPSTDSKPTPSSRASTSSTDSLSKLIRISRPFPLPAHVRSALHLLDEAGFVAYVVGGSVRDFLLGRESKDHDLATNATPDEICALFPDSITVGKAFGVIKVPVSHGTLLEIATFREDLSYRDHRHPAKVRFAGPVEDGFRRDFTINALFYDPKSARIIDPTGGEADLKAGIIRAIGDPAERFREDALRLLRAVRFATRLGFIIEPQTAEAIRGRARLIGKVSPERVREELTLMWTGPQPGQALEMLSRLGLLGQVLPEVQALHMDYNGGNLWNETIKMFRVLVQQNPLRSSALSWATALYDVGKPPAWKRSGGANFNGHDLDGARIATEIGARLKFSKAELSAIVDLLSDKLKFRDVFKMRESTLQRFIRQPGFEDLLKLHKADAVSSDGNLAYFEFCSSRWKELLRISGGFKDTPKILDGKDLIQLGFEPGPEFSAILREVEDLALEHKLHTKGEALEYVVKRFVK